MLAVLGAGVSGLAVGMVSGAPVYEATDGPGGLCSSYYVRPDGSEKPPRGHRPTARRTASSAAAVIGSSGEIPR